jgi:hypothetical protein
MNDQLSEAVKLRGKYRTKFRTDKGNPNRKVRDLEDLSLNESVRYTIRAQYRHSETHSAPFRRWLYTQVGRPFDDVYSEIAAASRQECGETTLKKMVNWLVTPGVVLLDGVLYRLERWGGWYPLRDDTLFVHPETKLLTLHKVPKVNPVVKPPTFILVRDMPGVIAGSFITYDGQRVGYRLMDGIWYYVVEQYAKSKWWAGKEDIKRLTKRQLNTKELRDLKISNKGA